jgi:hypothetical protein
MTAIPFPSTAAGDRAMNSRRVAGWPAQRLFVSWVVTAAIVGGCASAKRLGFADQADVPSVIIASSLFLVGTVALCIASWRDRRRRGTYLGIVFGTLAEIVIIRRVPAEYHEKLVIVGFGLLAAYIAASQLWPRSTSGGPATPTGVTAEDLVGANPLALSDRIGAPPKTGLVAFVATLTILLAVDITVRLL